MNKHLILFIGIISGLILVGVWRFILFNPNSTHIHANFNVVVNGQKEVFDSFVYYEETAACNTESHTSPKQRVHMHEPNNDLIHVHDEGVTWFHFFESLGWTIGDSVLETRTNQYIENNTNKLDFILNGKSVNSLNSVQINNEDTLLVSYGNNKSELTKLFDSITSSASEYNEISDPASCSGSKSTGFIDRLKYAVGL